MRIGFLVMPLLLLVFGCNKERKEQDKLYKEVMEIHDEVMPEMSSMRKLAKNLEEQANLILSDTSQVDSTRAIVLKETAEKVKKANESMMEWMREFNQVEEGTPHGEVVKYLLEQKQSISKVRDDMLDAKKEAEKYMTTD